MGEGTPRPVGERRRRREAARAAELAAQQAGTSRPLTRRELRWREAEEAARLEAIATGELRIDDVQEALGRSADPDPVPPAAGHASPTSPGSAVSAASGATAVSGKTATTGTAASAASATSGRTAPSGASTATAATAASGRTAASGLSAATAASAGAAPVRPPSRRSLRDRAHDAEHAPSERPTERTATGRRPVVRTPTTAQGIRVLDATGQLTGIQPVVRPDEPSMASPTEAGADDRLTVDGPVRTARDALAASSVPPSIAGAAQESAPAAAGRDGASVEDAAAPADTAAGAAAPRDDAAGTDVASPADSPAELPVAGALTPGDEPADDSGEFNLRPQWVAISSVSGTSPDEARAVPLSRRSTRPAEEPAASESSEEDAPAPRNPALTLVKVTVLAAVAVILGALIWLLGSEALGEDSALAPSTHTTITATYPEETRAR